MKNWKKILASTGNALLFPLLLLCQTAAEMPYSDLKTEQPWYESIYFWGGMVLLLGLLLLVLRRSSKRPSQRSSRSFKDRK